MESAATQSKKQKKNRYQPKTTGAIKWGDKRDKKRDVKNGNKDNFNYEKTVYTYDSPKFTEYYKFADVLTESEFVTFEATLKEKLPVTFRLNCGEHNYQRVSQLLNDPDFIKRFTDENFTVEPDEHGSLKTAAIDYSTLSMDCKPYYPNQTLFEMKIPRELLKKNLGLKKIHHMVIALADSGLITRQEIVSMLPPLLLDVKAHHSVFDMCAAPGSKTAQILELQMADHLKNNSNQTRPSGFVIANDADPKRAFMLTHQMNRLNSENIIITNHQAQLFPDLFYREANKGEDLRVKFDRICCDVPCSSDAAIRKIPQKWPTWNTRDSQSLHPLQITILRRGIQLLKVGGKITYSTCSLNPIENEAVVAAALKEFSGRIRLIKTSIPGFKHQIGLKEWKFLNSEAKEKNGDSWFVEYQNFQDVPANLHSQVKETMFKNHYSQDILDQLTSCIRVMPHHQNTSGFFITVIEKIAECDNDEPKITTEILPEPHDLVIQQDPRKRDFNFFRCDKSDPDVQYIKAYYGLANLNENLLITQDPAGMGRVYLIGKELSRFLHADSKRQLNIISMGVTLFQRNNSKGGSGVECIFRVSQDGINSVLPLMNEQRVIRTTSEIDFKRLIMHKYHDLTDLVDLQLRQSVDQISIGCFVIVFIDKDNSIEPVVMHKFARNTSSMIAKENLYSLHMRYLTAEERTTCATTVDHQFKPKLTVATREEDSD